MWYGENSDGYANFFAWDGGQGRGYNGHHYDIETVDGEHVVLKGPFSSRAGVINRVGEQHGVYDWGPVLDVRYKEDLDQLTPRTGAATLDVCMDAVDRFLESDSVELVREVKFDGEEPYYVPRRV